MSHDTQQPSGTMDVSELAKAIKVSTDAIYDSIRADELPVKWFRIGRKIRIVRASVLRLLADTDGDHDA